MAAAVAALQSSQAGASRPETPAGCGTLRGNAVGSLRLRQRVVLRGYAWCGAGRRQPVAAGMRCRRDEPPATGARLPASLAPRLLQGPAAGASCTGSGTGPPLHWPPEVQQGPEPQPDTGQEHGTAPHHGYRRAGRHCSSQTLSVPSLCMTKTCVWTSPWQKKERFCQQCSSTSPTDAPVNHQ